MQSMASEMLFRSFSSYEYGRNLYFLSGNEVFCWVCVCMHVSPFFTGCISVCGMWACTLCEAQSRLPTFGDVNWEKERGLKWMSQHHSESLPNCHSSRDAWKDLSLPSNPTFILLSSPIVSHSVLLFWTVWGELFCWRTDRQNATSHYIITFQCSVGVERLTKTAMSSRRILAHRF